MKVDPSSPIPHPSSFFLRKYDWVWIALIGLLWQSFWAMQMAHPSYMDAYYYATNGQQLAAGNGFSEQIIWQFLDQPAGLPTPSHTYWMPLTSILAAAGYRLNLFTNSFRSVQLPFWILAGLLPVLAYQTSHFLVGKRWQAWTAALLTVSGGFYNNFYNQPSTFAPFAWFGGLCLLALAQGWQANRPSSLWWLLAGVMAGLGHLTRGDGVLLLLVALVVAVDWRKLRAYRGWLMSVGLLVLGYGLSMGGWFWHNWQLFERPLSTIGTQTIFLTTYDDLFAYGRSFDWSHLQAWGWENILQSRLAGVSSSVQTFVVINGLVFLTPFVLIAWWRLIKTKWGVIRPFTLYTISMYAAMSLIFTLPGGRGGLFHSSAALFPWTMALAASGIRIAVDWVATRLSHWKPERAGRIFAALFVAVAMLMSVSLGIVRRGELPETAVYEQIGAQLPADAVVMVGNPPGFYYHTGHAAVTVPNEPAHVLLQAAAQYQVSYLILDQNRPVPLAELYLGDENISEIHLLADYEGIKLYEIEIPAN